ncbi:MAG: InlB B-repeat-containing protein [Oscillospiraceae bacterium]|jgi:uncharacterized repeat protein (TIGR02543 family)|nr:InlB B-repeat-containing protein [Oscillospiraceae bacterium]
MRSIKARRVLGAFLAAVMVFSVMAGVLPSYAFAAGYEGALPYVPRVTPNPPSVKLTLPEQITVAANNGFTAGNTIQGQDNALSIRMAPGETQRFVSGSFHITPSSLSGNMIDLQFRFHYDAGSDVAYWDVVGGSAVPDDTIKIVITYDTVTPGQSGYYNTWKTPVYVKVGSPKAPAFRLTSVHQLRSLNEGLWVDSAISLQNTIGRVPNVNYLESTGTDYQMSYSPGIQLQNNGIPLQSQWRAYATIWGGRHVTTSGDARTPQLNAPAYASGVLIRNVQTSGNDWWTSGNDAGRTLNLGAGGSTGLNSAEMNTWFGNIPEGHYYFDQSLPFNPGTVYLTQNTDWNTGDNGTTTFGITLEAQSGGIPATTKFEVAGHEVGENWAAPYNINITYTNPGSALQPNDSWLQYSISRALRARTENVIFTMCPKHLNIEERLRFVVHYYNKQILRGLLEQLQTLNPQESWFQTSAGAGKTSWGQFEAAYANAMTVLARREVTQADINSACNTLLANIQADLLPTPMPAQIGANEFYSYASARGNLVYKPLDYARLDTLLERLPPEYGYTVPDQRWPAEAYWEAADYVALDRAVKDIEYDYGQLDSRYEQTAAQLRKNLADALNGLQYKAYQVQFQGAGGTVHENQMVRVHDAITPPAAAPSRDNYIFGGWAHSDAPETPVDFSGGQVRMVPENQVYVPIWIKNALTGHFILNNDPLNPEAELVVDAFVGGNLYPPSNVTNPGYDFDYWEEHGVPLAEGTWPIEAYTRQERYFYAHWKPKKYPLKFYGTATGTTLWQEFQQDYNSLIEKPAAIPLNKGYRFDGWTRVPSSEAGRVDWTAQPRMPSLETNIYPLYKNNAFHLTFYKDIPNNGSVLRDGFFYPDDEVMTVQSQAQADWYGLENGAPFDWITAPGEYILDLEPEDYPEKEGFTFTGWLYLNELDGSLLPFAFGQYGSPQPAHNLYLFPNFVGGNMKINFVPSAGGVDYTGSVLPVVKNAGEPFGIGELPTLTFPGYRFLGWAYADGTAFDDAVMPGNDEGEITLYACWKALKDDYIDIKMKANKPNGTLLMPEETLRINLTARSTFPVYGNYTLIYYDTRYFEPVGTDGIPFAAPIHNGDEAAPGQGNIRDFLVIPEEEEEGLFSVGALYGDLNVRLSADYPPDWKNEDGTLKAEVQHIGVIAVKVPYDVLSQPTPVELAEDTPWFSFDLRVKPDCEATPEGKTADIFFSPEVIRSFEDGITTTGMYYCAGPGSDSYVDVDVLTTPALQFRVQEAVENAITLTFRIDNTAEAHGTFADNGGDELVVFNVPGDWTLGDLIEAGRLPSVITENAYALEGWIPSGYGAALIDEDFSFNSQSWEFLARFIEVKRYVQVQYRMEELKTTPAAPKTYVLHGSGKSVEVTRGSAFDISPTGAQSSYYKTEDDFFGFHRTNDELLKIEAVMDGENVVYQTFDRNMYTLTFDISGADSDSPNWDSVERQYGYKTADAIEELNLGDPKKAGYTFEGWQCADGSTLPTIFDADSTVKPIWLGMPVTVRLQVTDKRRLPTEQGYTFFLEWTPGEQVRVGDVLSRGVGANSLPNMSQLQALFPLPSTHEIVFNSAINAYPVEATETGEVIISYATIQEKGAPVNYVIHTSHAEFFEAEALNLPSQPYSERVKLYTMEEILVEYPDLAGYAVDSYEINWNPCKYGEQPTVEAALLDGSVYVDIHLRIPDYLIIKYNGNGGTGEAPAPKTVYPTGAEMATGSMSLHSDELAGQGELVRAGWRFLGWNTSASAKTALQNTNFTVSVSYFNQPTGFELFAVWAPEVTFVTSSGELELPEETAVRIYPGAESLVQPTSGGGSPLNMLPGSEDMLVCNKPGYQFLGWSSDAQIYATPLEDYTELPSVALLAPVTLHPVWLKLYYTVTFVLGEGVTAPAGWQEQITRIAWGDDLVIPMAGDANVPTKPGYTFSGWIDGSTSTQYKAGSLEDIQRNHTLYAEMTQDVYTVTFAKQEGVTGEPPEAMEFTYDLAVAQSALPPVGALAKEGYPNFLGWSTDPEAQDVTPTIAITGDTTLYPVFSNYVEAYLEDVNGCIVDDNNPDAHFIYGFPDNTSKAVLMGEDGKGGQYLQIVGDGSMSFNGTNTYRVATGDQVTFTDNNTGESVVYTLVIFGDVTRDGRVNNADAQLCRARIGSSVGEVSAETLALSFAGNETSFIAAPTNATRLAIEAHNKGTGSLLFADLARTRYIASSNEAQQP